MNASNDIQNAKDPDLRASLNALRRAAQLARKTAIQTDTSIIVVRDGKMVRITLLKICGRQLRWSLCMTKNIEHPIILLPFSVRESIV